MSGKRLDVQFCVLSRTIRRYGPHPTADLLGVDYTYNVPPDTEFPRVVAHLNLFARFLVAGLGPTVIAVRVVRLDDDGIIRERVNEYRFTVPFDPSDRVREQPFRLPFIRLSGEGLYAVQIGRRVRHRWKGDRWKILGTDYFRVVREF